MWDEWEMTHLFVTRPLLIDTYWCWSDLFLRKKYVLCVFLTKQICETNGKWPIHSWHDPCWLTYSYKKRWCVGQTEMGDIRYSCLRDLLLRKKKCETNGKLTHSYVTQLLLIDLFTRENIMCEANGSGTHYVLLMFKRFVLTKKDMSYFFEKRERKRARLCVWSYSWPDGYT